MIFKSRNMKEIVSAIVDKALWAENPYDRIPVTGDIQRFCIIQAKETRSRKLCFACGYFAKSHALACCRPFGGAFRVYHSIQAENSAPQYSSVIFTEFTLKQAVCSVTVSFPAA